MGENPRTIFLTIISAATAFVCLRGKKLELPTFWLFQNPCAPVQVKLLHISALIYGFL